MGTPWLPMSISGIAIFIGLITPTISFSVGQTFLSGMN